MASRRPRRSGAHKSPPGARPIWLPDFFTSDRDALKIYYSVVADSIEEAFRRNRVFFYGLQNMMVQLRSAKPMKFQRISKMQSDFAMNAADHIEWLDSQVSVLERIYIAIQMRKANREPVDPRSLVPPPRLPANRTLQKIGKIFALWLRDIHGNVENLDNEKDKNKHTSKARKSKKDTKTKLPEDVMSSTKREQTVKQAEFTAGLMSLVSAVGVLDGELPPREAGGGARQARGANCVDGGGRRQVRSGREASEVLPPLFEENESACEILAECDKESTSSSDNMSEWSTKAVYGGPPSNDGRSSPINVNIAALDVLTRVAGSSDISSDDSVKETAAEKDKESPSNEETRRSVTTEPTTRESRSDAVLHDVWLLVDQLLRLYYDHMRYTALLQLYLLKEGAERSQAPRLLAHLLKTFEFVEEDMIHADDLLARISLFAWKLDDANWWSGHREGSYPRLPDYPLVPGFTRPPGPTKPNCFKRIWRRCLCFFRRLVAKRMTKQRKYIDAV